MLRELADVNVRSLAVIFKRSWNWTRITETGGKKRSLLFARGARRRIWRKEAGQATILEDCPKLIKEKKLVESSHYQSMDLQKGNDAWRLPCRMRWLACWKQGKQLLMSILVLARLSALFPHWHSTLNSINPYQTLKTFRWKLRSAVTTVWVKLKSAVSIRELCISIVTNPPVSALPLSILSTSFSLVVSEEKKSIKILATLNHKHNYYKEAATSTHYFFSQDFYPFLSQLALPTSVPSFRRSLRAKLKFQKQEKSWRHQSGIMLQDILYNSFSINGCILISIGFFNENQSQWE